MTRRRQLLLGVAIGAAGIAVTAALMAITGDVHSAGFELDLGVLVVALVILGAAAVVEELVFRALVLGGLLRLTGSAVLALVVSSAAFGLLHLVTTADATTLSVLSTTAGGVMYGLAYLRTGRIWLGVGIHFAWNFVQATVLGFTMSGTDDYSGALWHLDGGGDYGPEGTVWSLVGRAVVIALVLVVTRPRDPRPAP
ncbi:CPBP family intramembrane glutamic endopeptidase [Nocardioides sp. SR21]|uniref:CPBP family intramembrane glutamic endopeptidase n=1 Tax=Nocardioides sp. SR21 TaxID=2919501 RepID=UPI001FAAD482|nr:CPBP family intramembrane glutamic endopeptidase [Nocardioides sp. SR21]